MPNNSENKTRIWNETLEILRELKQMTGKNMVRLLHEAVLLLQNKLKAENGEK